MPEPESENVPLDERPIQIPPAFEAFVGKLRGDKKKLMKDKAFGSSAEQLRGFIGTFTYPRFTEMVKLFASGVFEAYSLAASNTEQLRRLHAFVVEELDHLRGELDDIDSDRRGVNPAIMDEFQQAFFALGAQLKEKLPEDKDTEAAYNRCIELLGDVVNELLGSRRDYRDEDDEDDEGDGGDEGDKEPSSSSDDEEASPAEETGGSDDG